MSWLVQTTAHQVQKNVGREVTARGDGMLWLRLRAQMMNADDSRICIVQYELHHSVKDHAWPT